MIWVSAVGEGTPGMEVVSCRDDVHAREGTPGDDVHAGLPGGCARVKRRVVQAGIEGKGVRAGGGGSRATGRPALGTVFMPGKGAKVYGPCAD